MTLHLHLQIVYTHNYGKYKFMFEFTHFNSDRIERKKNANLIPAFASL